MSIPESVLREIERAIQAAEFPRGMSVHDGKAKVHSSHLRRLLAELAALRAERDALRAAVEEIEERTRPNGDMADLNVNLVARAALGER